MNVGSIYFLKYDDRLRSISFLARAPDCMPKLASSSITLPKLPVKTPTPTSKATPKRAGTYGGGNSAISNSAVDSAIHVVVVASAATAAGVDAMTAKGMGGTNAVTGAAKRDKHAQKNTARRFVSILLVCVCVCVCVYVYV